MLKSKQYQEESNQMPRTLFWGDLGVGYKMNVHM